MSKAEISQIRGSSVLNSGNRPSQSVYRRENSQDRFTTSSGKVINQSSGNSNIVRNANSGNTGIKSSAHSTSPKKSEYTRSTGNYRVPVRQNNAASGSNSGSGISTGKNSSTNRSEFQRSNINNTYSQPTRNSGTFQSSGSSTQSSQSSGSGRSSSGSGSVYRR